MDHLNKFIQYAQGRTEGKKGRRNPKTESLTNAVVRVDSITSGIDQGLMARAAFECKQYARALMNLEQQAVLRLQTTPDRDLQEYYEKIHEIYAELDEPDGMAGISTKVLSPSLEHQIREHESTGRWTAAQSCWEVRLQQEPDNIESHIGLMRCLKNLGHYGMFFQLRILGPHSIDRLIRRSQDARRRYLESQTRLVKCDRDFPRRERLDKRRLVDITKGSGGIYLALSRNDNRTTASRYAECRSGCHYPSLSAHSFGARATN